MFQAIHAERLLRLAEHLRCGELGHKRFDYSIIENSCGTAGCAWGEMPTLFPETFEMRRHEVEFIGRNCDYSKQGEEFTGLTDAEWDYLFQPGEAGNPLPNDASKIMVSNHIRKFVTKKCKEVGIKIPSIKNIEDCPMCDGKGKIEIKAREKAVVT